MSTEGEFGGNFRGDYDVQVGGAKLEMIMGMESSTVLGLLNHNHLGGVLEIIGPFEIGIFGGLKVEMQKGGLIELGELHKLRKAKEEIVSAKEIISHRVETTLMIMTPEFIDQHAAEIKLLGDAKISVNAGAEIEIASGAGVKIGAGGKVTIGAPAIELLGNVTINGNLVTNGAVTINGVTSITGATTITGNNTVTGEVIATGDLVTNGTVYSQKVLTSSGMY
ncbi:MAG: hypothetical protein HQK55_00760 [Deltaproteobacteria bacterium]|nr:hypothetical protein [Deltaproteobacteria bacterium]